MEAVEFALDFEGPRDLVQAVFLGVAEGSSQVFINGAMVGVIEGASSLATLDLTRHVRPGPNRVLISAQASGRPPMVASLIELNSGLAQQEWIPSGPRWVTRAMPGVPMSTPLSPRPWRPVFTLGGVDATPGGNPFDPRKAIDAYNSWKLASVAGNATDAAALQLPRGFRAELVRSALTGEGSWVAMSFDDEGRLVLAREKQGLIRLTLRPPGLTVTSVEVIDNSLLECRGLAHRGNSLFAHANNSKFLARLDDANQDGFYESKTELLHTEGGVGHGRNHLRWGLEGWLYLAQGNNVKLPARVSADSPLRLFAEDQWVPCPWDPGMFDGDVLAPAGHILTLDPRRPVPLLFAGGFRNALDVDFNEDGEMFTFDADMEWDVGAPWYMPNRVLHVVSGGDYGFRRGTGRFPESFADTLPAVAHVGLASPTAVLFGHGASFPPRYRRAFFICDWAYGRVLAVHLEPDGASYRGTLEPFLAGRPFNVTDACIGPDGAMWLITGGRGTQSGLYRVAWNGGGGEPESVSGRERLDRLKAARLREVRKEFESWHKEFEPVEVASRLNKIWEHLNHEDRWIRHAARIALERIPAHYWRERALLEYDTSRLWPALLALARAGNGGDLEPILNRFALLASVRWPGLDETDQLGVLRALGVALARHGTSVAKSFWGSRFDRMESGASPEVERELCRMLAFFESPRLLDFALSKLKTSRTSEDLLHYLFFLRNARGGWTLESRKVVFEALRRAGQLPGARTYYKALADVRKELIQSLTAAEKESLSTLLDSEANPSPSVNPSPVVREWKLADLEPWLSRVSAARDPEKGREAWIAAQCGQCHRAGTSVPGQATQGPDLAGISGRFGRRDLLEHILEPSKVIDEKYRMLVLQLEDGSELSGLVEGESETEWVLRENPLEAKTTRVLKSSIQARRVSDISPMPAGLLNALTADQILDLLAFLEFHALR